MMCSRALYNGAQDPLGPPGVAMFFGLLGQQTLIPRGGAGGATKNQQFHLSVIKMY